MSRPFQRPRLLDPRVVPTGPVRLIDGHPLAVGLEAFWPLGTSTQDVTKFGRNCSAPTGTVIVAAGPRGPCRQFPAGSADLPFAPIGLPSGAQPRTMFAWVQTSTANTNDASFVGYGSGATGTGNSCLIGSGFGGGGKIYFAGYGADLTGNTVISDGNLHHVAMSYDGTTARLYADGVFDTSAIISLNTIATVGYLGSMPWGAPGTAFGSLIGQLFGAGIANRALSAQQVAWLAAEPFIMLEPDEPVWYYGTTGYPLITGTAALFQAAQTILAIGSPRVSGLASLAQGAESLTASGSPVVAASASLAQAGQSIVAAAVASVVGALIATQAAQGVAAAGTSSISGAASLLQASTALTAVGTVLISGAAALVQAAQTIVANDNPLPVPPVVIITVSLPLAFGAYIRPLGTTSPTPTVRAPGPVNLIAADPAPIIRTRDPSNAI